MKPQRCWACGTSYPPDADGTLMCPNRYQSDHSQERRDAMVAVWLEGGGSLEDENPKVNEALEKAWAEA